jgi:hypothetical protein
VEKEQQEAVDRLPQSAKEKTRQRAQERVLFKYLGIEQAEQPQGRFRNPG